MIVHFTFPPKTDFSKFTKISSQTDSDQLGVTNILVRRRVLWVLTNSAKGPNSLKL